MFDSRRPVVIAVGASAGGLQQIALLLSEFPEELPAIVLVVLHRPIAAVSHLPQILSRATRMPVVVAGQGQELSPGNCYVGTPSRHLAVGASLRAELIVGERRRNRTIDTLFHSVARHHGRSAAGVLLSGLLDDGSRGLAAIKAAGGMTLVQCPDDAAYGAMPQNALARATADIVGPTRELGQALRAALMGVPRRHRGHRQEAVMSSMAVAGIGVQSVDQHLHIGPAQLRARLGT